MSQKGDVIMSKQLVRKTLSDVMPKYATITVYSGHGGIISPWERELLKHYQSRQIVNLWVNPIDCHAYIKIK